MRSCAKQFATAATVRGVTAQTALSQEFPTRIGNWIKRHGATTYGLLQCYSAQRLLFLGRLQDGSIKAIEKHLAARGLTLCEENQQASARIKEVFEDPKKAPVMAAACLGILNLSEVESFKVKSLDDFAAVTRGNVSRVVNSAPRLVAFEEFLKALGISFKK